MQIACPDCAARYEVPDDKLRPGRPARCAQCHRTWVPLPLQEQTGSGDEPTGEAPGPARPFGRRTEAPPALELPGVPVGGSFAAADPLAPLRRRRSGLGLKLAWAATAIILAAAIGAGFRFRIPIEAYWPPSARLYHLLGLP